jgi:ABC-2 type transport system permease protein
MPFAAPALWAMSNGTAVTAAQLGLALAVPLVFGVLSCVAWSRLQLDR